MPVFKDGGVNPRAVKQISSGSILGMSRRLGIEDYTERELRRKSADESKIDRLQEVSVSGSNVWD